MKSIVTSIILVLLVFVGSAQAMDLQTAKNQGLVGETAGGYLAAVQSATPEVTLLLEKINTERRKLYKKIAQKNGTPLQTVEQLAGEKAIGKSKPGHYVKPGSSWEKK